MILLFLLLASVNPSEAAGSNIGTTPMSPCAIQKGPYQPLTFYDIRHVDESLETVRTGPLTGCSVCCPHGWNQCDDGSCMPPDIFCRYPESCCSEKYCGLQCTKKSGAACGDLWAPANFTCCSPESGQLCAKPDICCGDHCCPDTHFCCSNETCCQNDKQICCNGLCCEADQECCGDHCCLKGEHDVCQAGQDNCCPGAGRLCGDNLCCPEGDICHNEANKCCPIGQWCPFTSICCPENTYCNPAGACCQNGYQYCPGGATTNCHRSPFDKCCSDGSACTSDYPHCTGNGYCCPSGFPHYCPERNECFTSECNCCGDGGCCSDGNSCAGNGECQWCHQVCHSHWWHTHCHTECDHRDSVSHYGAILASGPMLPGDEDVVNSLRGMKPIRAASVELHAPIPAANKFLSSIKNTDLKRTNGTPGRVPPFQKPPAPHQLISKNSTACWANGAIGTDACGLLDCLENMMSNCGGNNSIVERHELYCAGYEATWNLFDKAGQAFLTATRECIFKEYVAAFDVGVGIPCCENIDTWGSCMDFTCWIKSGFCQNPAVFYPNVHAFEKLMEMYGTDNIFNIYFNQCQGKPCHD